MYHPYSSLTIHFSMFLSRDVLVFISSSLLLLSLSSNGNNNNDDTFSNHTNINDEIVAFLSLRAIFNV